MKKLLSISVIIILGLLLRLLFIDKAEGLWNDEYTSWMIASVPFNEGFWQAVKTQCHMPFYYIYLKLFMLYSQSDLWLRLSSVLAGAISIPVMYFVGKEKNVGMLCAFFTSISAFLIYYSQEVRFYGILFFFSALSLLFTMRLVKNVNKKNLFLYILSNFMILFTHTIGFVYVFFNLLYVSFMLKERYKKTIAAFWLSTLVLFGFLTPLLYKIFTSNPLAQWWSDFNISKLAFLFTDYFSPVLTNLVNSPPNFFTNLSLFAVIPASIAVYGIAKALRDKELRGLSYVVLATLIILVGAAISGKMVFITKYSIEIYPTLILLVCFGLNNSKKWLMIVFFAINLLCIFHPLSAPKIKRSEGHKIAADILKHANLKSGDSILLTYYSQEKFDRYFDFKPYRVYSINKGNFNWYTESVFAEKFKNEFVNNMKSGDKLTILFLDSVSSSQSEDAPLLFKVFSSVKNLSIKEGVKTLQIERYEERGSWSALTFHKT